MQTVVIALATLMAVAASVLAGSLLVASGGPFDATFARQRGAHLGVQYAGSAGEGELQSTGRAEGVEASAGPFRTVTLTPEFDEDFPEAEPPLTIAGRTERTGPRAAVDRLALTEGRWATRPGEIVLPAGVWNADRIGHKVTFPDLPGKPALKVVGTARSATGTADAWATPGQVQRLAASGASAGRQMLYRFTEAATAAQVAAGRTAVTADLAKGTVLGTQSWLTVKKTAERDTALYVPFLVAFGLLGLVMSVLIVGNVVAAAVGAGTRRIGILKAIGFTPGQVVRAYVAQALLPAAVGTALGVAAGHVLAVPILAEAEEAYAGAGLGIDPWVDAAVVGGVLTVVAITAWASAWRAGRLRTVDALAVGRAPRTRRGRLASRLAGRLPLPRPVALGLVRPLARPGRALAMGSAIVFGATAVTFTVGLGSSLGEVMAARDHSGADVTVHSRVMGPGPGGPDGPGGPGGPGGGPSATAPKTPADPAAVREAITAQPGTRASYAIATTRARIAGVSGSTTVTAFTDDASWGGYAMVEGRWLRAPGEAVVPTAFLTTTGKRIGDPLTLDGRTGQAVLRIVGEVLDPRYDGMQVFTDAASARKADSGLAPDEHRIALEPGTDSAAYVSALDKDLAGLGLTAEAGSGGGESEMVTTLNALSALLTLLLVAVAALGVLNGVVLDTRERVRELGIHKALGMTPRQTVAMVLTSVTVTGLAGGAIGVPLGMALHAQVVPAMGESAGLRFPDSVLAVYDAPGLLLLGLGGLLIATLGALLPAGWAARTRTATALRTE
ncbi:ABC transporter permease [Streptomyces sp. NPDC050418]|uniref:ABC transporter permease n=1 Tax=Streptomyces sp. NPDC050418 TaxID=3365612 RepID=UPI0037B0B86E